MRAAERWKIPQARSPTPISFIITGVANGPMRAASWAAPRMRTAPDRSEKAPSARKVLLSRLRLERFSMSGSIGLSISGWCRLAIIKPITSEVMEDLRWGNEGSTPG
ncbi:hypothetical protein D9M72_603040 [compost metagenome]